jgi:hypothetical protein
MSTLPASAPVRLDRESPLLHDHRGRVSKIDHGGVPVRVRRADVRFRAARRSARLRPQAGQAARTMERATFMTTWREKKLKGLVIGATGAAGNAAARVEPFVTRNGIYAYGFLPEPEDVFQRQAREQDRKQREALLHQIQRTVADHVLVAPLFQQAFICAVGARVEESGLGHPGLSVCRARRGHEAQVEAERPRRRSRAASGSSATPCQPPPRPGSLLTRRRHERRRGGGPIVP